MYQFTDILKRLAQEKEDLKYDTVKSLQNCCKGKKTRMRHPQILGTKFQFFEIINSCKHSTFIRHIEINSRSFGSIFTFWKEKSNNGARRKFKWATLIAVNTRIQINMPRFTYYCPVPSPQFPFSAKWAFSSTWQSPRLLLSTLCTQLNHPYAILLNRLSCLALWSEVTRRS